MAEHHRYEIRVCLPVMELPAGRFGRELCTYDRQQGHAEKSPTIVLVQAAQAAIDEKGKRNPRRAAELENSWLADQQRETDCGCR